MPKTKSAATTAKKPTKKAPSAEAMLFDSKVPVEMRRELLHQLVVSGEGEPALVAVLERATEASTAEQYKKKKRELEDLLDEMNAGPLRAATFLRMLPPGGHGARAQVLFPDGGSASCIVPDPDLAQALVIGDTVWLEAHAKALLFREPADTVPAEVGEEAWLERVLSNGQVEVRMREERFVFRATAELRAQLDGDEAKPGTPLVVCARRMLAFRALPEGDGTDVRRFVQFGVPNIVIERDLGSPPAYLDDLTEHVERELSDPELGRRYGLRRSRMVLLTGVPGTGKTFSMLGLWNRLYEMMSAATGVPVEDLPPRVLQLKSSQVLDKWVGSSDRNLAAFFDEVEQVANETFVGPDGREHELPTLVIAEEIDALARTRGEDSIHDRIQTTLLGALDGNNAVFRDKLILFLFTTNTPELVDPAFLRRAGGITATFGRMTERQLVAVLSKKLARLPVQAADGQADDEARADIVGRATAWLYGTDAEETAVCELAIAGQQARDVRHGRDFLTAALIDRAVQEAANDACRIEAAGGPPGIGAAELLAAIDGQIAAVVEQLTPQNCGRYLTLDDGVRVATVHRRARPALSSFQLERAI